MVETTTWSSVIMATPNLPVSPKSPPISIRYVPVLGLVTRLVPPAAVPYSILTVAPAPLAVKVPQASKVTTPVASTIPTATSFTPAWPVQSPSVPTIVLSVPSLKSKSPIDEAAPATTNPPPSSSKSTVIVSVVAKVLAPAKVKVIS